jgi:hypothetical protein
VFRIRNERAWKFATSSGRSASFANFGAGTGDSHVDASERGPLTYHKASAGAGISVGIKPNVSSPARGAWEIRPAKS